MASGLESEFVTLHEIVKAAKIRLNPNIWDYLIGGTETETTLRRNRMALDSIAFKPRVLRNVSRIDPSSEILGKKMRLPLMLAPVGSLESFEPGGGITVAKGAGAGNVAMLISSVTTLKLEDIVKGGGGPKIYQLYVRGDDAWVADRVKQVRLAESGVAVEKERVVHLARRLRDCLGGRRGELVGFANDKMVERIALA